MELDRGPKIGIGIFWKALEARAVGAAVVAARDDAGPAGLLALSATHLCASPPILMVSISRKTSALATILNSGHFSINYLAADHTNLADIFGGKESAKGADRFDPDDWTTLTTGAPILRNAVGALDCLLEDTIERHDTLIAFGRMVDFTGATGDRQPLISFAGRMGV
ncbi:flavin reductase family protein [Corticibacterium sp. UT-5YL-CI-8]|nr:flavin reductase family protein [Tianweitania sp. UT-5YL-CI-8]